MLVFLARVMLRIRRFRWDKLDAAEWASSEIVGNGWLGMNSHEIRQVFTNFFVERHGHMAVASSSLIPHGDPTVLLTTAGMQQFTPYFLGLEEPPNRRLTSIQKCFRAVGKADDVLEVGDPTHLTFFEMLGNFSVGDYFKDEAIEMAWELVTGPYGIDPDRIWTTVHPSDDYSRDYWRKSIGIRPERVQDDPGNTWGPVGDTGPYGPNTEIYVDLEYDEHPGDPGRGPMSEDEDRYIEIWNLVFVEFNRLPDGSPEQLAMQNVDTGSGLERVAVVLQGVKSIYETDLFRPIVARAAEIAGATFGESEQVDNALRIIADHGRGVAFLIADGVLPSNEGRGYVLRRILRRAVQKARAIGVERPFLSDIADSVIEEFRGQYPELARRREVILRTIGHEEEAFGRTLATGMVRLEALLEQAVESGDKTIPGAEAFRLHDTYGFPVDLTVELATTSGIDVDVKGFREALNDQRARSRASLGTFADATRQRAPLYAAVQGSTSNFVGYESHEADTVIAAILGADLAVETIEAGETAEIVLARTPFYAESGGQVGDQGEILTSTGRFQVADTQRPAPGVVVHIGEVVEGYLQRGQSATAVVDANRRAAVRRNHTATHLIHEALRRVLGEQTQQAGSLVAPDRLRFDFTSQTPLGPDGLDEVMRLANQQVLANKPISIQQEAFDDAVSRGAMALFGEKYGDVVRTVAVDGYSLELCGGTHVSRTGDIGPIIIQSESSIGSGIRRIEAITGEPALAYLLAANRQLHHIGRDLRSPVDQVFESVERLLVEARQRDREIEQLKLQIALSNLDALVDAAREVDGTAYIATRVEAEDRATMLEIGDRLRDRLRSGVVVVGAEVDGAPAFVAMVTSDAVGRGVHAGQIIQSIAPIVGGRGGGRPEVAQGGGSDLGRLNEALEAVEDAIRQQVAG